MSILTKALASAKPGTRVRLTQLNGNVLDGIILENDGKDSLSVRISATASFRYQGIAGIEISAEPESTTEAVVIPAVSEEKTVPETKPKKTAGLFPPDVPVEVPTVVTSLALVKNAFGLLLRDENKQMTNIHNRFQNCLKMKDARKISQCVSDSRTIMKKKKWENAPNFNRYYAYLTLADELYAEAADSFFCAGEIENAVRTAYHGAADTGEEELYAQAGALAVVCLIDKDKMEYYSEAAEVLKQSAGKCMDISFVSRILQEGNGMAKQMLVRVLWYLCGKCDIALENPDDIDTSVEKLSTYFTKKVIAEELVRLIGAPEGEELPEDTEEPVEPESPEPPVILTSKTLEGFIVSYQPTAGVGKVRGSSGKTFEFASEDVKDENLLNQLVVYRGQSFDEIPAEFVIQDTAAGDAVVTSVKYPKTYYYKSRMEAELSQIAGRVNRLMQEKRYDEIIPIGEQLLTNGNIDEGFGHLAAAYMTMSKQNPDDESHLNNLRSLVERYAQSLTKNIKNMEVLRQAYGKLDMYEDCLETLNLMLTESPDDAHGRILGYVQSKADCYRKLGDIPSAIAQLNEWLAYSSKYRVPDAGNIRGKSIYPDLAELCVLMGDYDKAKELAEKCADPERKAGILAALPADPDDEPDPVEEEEAEEEELSTVSITEYYDDYYATETFRLAQDDKSIFEAIGGFPADRKYALLAWLTALARIAENSEAAERTSGISMKYNEAQTISAVEELFSWAFRNPLTYREDFAAVLPETTECAGKCIPGISDGLFAAAVLRALFHHCDDVQQYHYEALCEAVSENNALTERFSQLPLVSGMLLEFRQKTGYGINVFAKYRTNHAVLSQAIENARKCLDEITKRLDGYENMGRVRKTRDILFGDPESILREGLGIAVNNEIKRAAWLKETLNEMFIRSGRPFSSEHLDSMKINEYIDDAWILAKQQLIDEGYTVSNPRDNLIAERRNNITKSINRILNCLCEWIEAAEQSAEAENPYAKKIVDETAPRLIEILSAMIRTGRQYMEEHGFDWGTEAVCSIGEELHAKLDGSFDFHAQKYFFLDFLRSPHVLLDENYMPDMNATFCDLPEFTLPERIRRHAECTLSSLEERLKDIFEDDASKNNVRSAQLIRDYGEDMGITELAAHDVLRYYHKCLTSGRTRLQVQYEDFAAELELCEQYGSLSDVAGEKTRILRNITTWYRICSLTGDYGFYISILDAYRTKITDAASKHGEHLMRQLAELESDSSYEFGVYPPEKIRGYIEDNNFTVAENMLNCIRRHDVDMIADYAEEPFGYLLNFFSEAAINHRVTSIMAGPLDQSIIKSYQKKDLESALRHVTNNAMKDIRGGVNLINSWIHRSATAEKVTKLLSLLGMGDCSVAKEESKRESYLAKRPVRKGKVTYSHPIPAFGSLAEEEEFRVLCLYGSFDCVRLLDVFREINTTAKHTMVFLDFPLNVEERRKLARKLKEEKSFAKSFLVIDRVLLFYLARHYSSNSVNRMLMAVGMPFAYYQPFVERSKDIMPPELFTGREEALVSIEQPNGANLVYGGRQLGKSALLKMAKHNIDGNSDGARAVLVEIKDLDYKESAKEVSYRLMVEGVLPDGSETDDWDTLTRKIETRLRSDNPAKIGYLLLMLDEADAFIESCKDVGHRPIALLKNLMPGKFKIVMAGLHNISRFNRDTALHRNSLLVHLDSIIVKPFERPEAIKLLTNTLSYLGFRFKEESVISLILAKTNYFPGLIQLYCQKLLETMRNSDYAGYGQFNTPPYEITESHFKKVLTDRDFAEEIRNKLEMTLFVEEEGHSHYHIIALLLSYLHYTSPSENGHTPEEIYALADEHDIKRITSLKHEQVQELMHEMWDLNILTAKDEHYVFATEGFREMLGDQKTVFKSIIEYFEEGQK